ncbi:MAG: NAD+ diphosphatase [Paraglaciecola sp.]|jgi:NAD+ diphosphatase|uniref:NAD(+) diphosphatase n=1 Tax=uncultured Paraglaciecola sp. TaxID=1765024 RepID=UPI0025E8E609|nr:NAD(+) diphosphatase [uncultured Paraglaciecola sp.]
MIEQNILITAETRAIWLIFSGEKVFQSSESSGLLITTWGALNFAHAYQEQIVRIGSHGDLPCFLIDMGNEHIEQNNLSFISMRALLMQSETSFFGIASRAWQVALFMRTHRFCGQCGTAMQQINWEMAVQCSRCQHRCYPRISPCIIVSIRHEGKILLAQGKPQRSRQMFSTLAGFVESGEKLEQAVHREVFEEVGITVKNLRYFSSQPWPFPHSLMVGFLADFDSGEIEVDGKEILEAYWFDPDKLPNIPPKLSIAGQLIQHTIEEIKQQKNITIPSHS